MIRRPPRSTRTDTLLPYTTLFRSGRVQVHEVVAHWVDLEDIALHCPTRLAGVEHDRVVLGGGLCEVLPQREVEIVSAVVVAELGEGEHTAWLLTRCGEYERCDGQVPLCSREQVDV